MDPELMAALQGGGGGAPMGPPPPGAGAMPPMPMGPGAPPMGGTPADIGLQISLAMKPVQEQQQAALMQQQQQMYLSELMAAMAQAGNPLGAAAGSEGALPVAPDPLDAAPGTASPDDAMAMSGGV